MQTLMEKGADPRGRHHRYRSNPLVTAMRAWHWPIAISLTFDYVAEAVPQKGTANLFQPLFHSPDFSAITQSILPGVTGNAIRRNELSDNSFAQGVPISITKCAVTAAVYGCRAVKATLGHDYY